MKYEVERKFKLADPAALIRRVTELGGRFSQPETQSDTYFTHPCRDFAATDEALRVRTIADRNYVTYKGPKIDAKTKTRQELEFPLATDHDHSAMFRELLSALGFQPVTTVRKQRSQATLTVEGRPFNVDLDEVDQVGSYVELETMAEEAEVQLASEKMAILAEQLGVSLDERRSYLELLLAQQKLG